MEKTAKTIEKVQDHFLNASLNGLVNSALEKQKSLLTLSVAAIGFLLTIYSPANHNRITDVLATLSTLFLLACIALILSTFELNTRYIGKIIESELDNENTEIASKKTRLQFYLEATEKASSAVFFIGITLMIALIYTKENTSTAANTQSKIEKIEKIEKPETITPINLTIYNTNQNSTPSKISSTHRAIKKNASDPSTCRE